MKCFINLFSWTLFIQIAKDCNQRRPGVVFQVKKVSNPEKIDKEYEAFLSDMGMKQEDQKSEKPYVPPMGDLSKSFKPLSQPLMLTNGSVAAPGAASAEIRALSDPQKAGGLRVCIVLLLVRTFFAFIPMTNSL